MSNRVRAAVAFVILATATTLINAQPRRVLRVLFIGNSFTYFNNVGDIVAGIAEADRDGAAIESTLVTRGSASLKWHLENGPAKVAVAKGGWDFVVLQEKSYFNGERPSAGKPAVLGDPTEFYGSVREWVRMIRAGRAKPVLFMGWAFKERPREMAAFTEKVADAHFTIGKELDVPVAPVALAWTEATRRLRTLTYTFPTIPIPPHQGRILPRVCCTPQSQDGPQSAYRP
jgi:hypothetical protein